MSEVELKRWLQEGITAVKNGKRDHARILLTRVVQTDKENEYGWLWLSSVVDEEEDKRLCLENVLTINPDNVAARRALTAMLPPEPAVVQETVTAPGIEYQQEETFDDVWSRNVDMCGYCAAEISDPDQKRCPACGHNLLVKLYRYPKPGASLTALWVVLVGLAMSYGLGVGYTAIGLEFQLSVAGGLLIMLLLIVTAVGIYFRQFWAFVLAVVTLILILFAGIIQLFIFPEIHGLEGLDPAIQGFVAPLTSGFLLVTRGIQLLIAVIGLLMAFRAGPDFERVHYRQIARVTKGLSQAGDYHVAAKKLAGAGLWATAVLDWQRATALEPMRTTYKYHLGQAYARLGFYKRSLDVLESTPYQGAHSDVVADFDTLIQTVKQQAAQQSI